MSIIYDALKKVERANSELPQVNKQEKSPPRRAKPRVRMYLLSFLALLLGIWLVDSAPGLFINASRLKMARANVKPAGEIYNYAPVSPEVVKAASLIPQIRANFSLNGIFFSDNEGFALINNQILKEGDTIEGAKVLRISANEVELDLGESVIKLSSGS